MTERSAKEQLALIAAFAEDAQAGIEGMIVPFLIYGISTPVGTLFSFVLGKKGLAGFICPLWLVLTVLCQLILVLNRKSVGAKRIQRASDKIFLVLWGSIGGAILLTMIVLFFSGKKQLLSFNAGFFSMAFFLGIGCFASGILVQKKLQKLFYTLGTLWFVCGLTCLFVTSFMAPLIIAGAAFTLFALPAIFAAAAVHKRKENCNEKDEAKKQRF